jgi:hypothetical protein
MQREARGTRDAALSSAMLSEDRVTLRNLVLAVSASTLVGVLIGTTCLGHRAPPPAAVTETEAVGTTHVTSADEPAREGSLDISAVRPPSPPQASMPEAETSAEPRASRSVEPVAAPSATVAPSASAAPSATESRAPMPAPAAATPTPTPAPPRLVPRTPTEGLEAGAGGFLTEPAPYSATNLAPNPEAGAGPFVTEHVTPVVVP